LLKRWIDSSYLARYLLLNTVGISDHQVFPARTITNAPPVFCFDTAASRVATIEQSFRDDRSATGEDPIGHFLARTGTVALLVIQDDRLLLERYGDGYDRASICTSFSVAKSVTSALIGIALDERLLHALDDPLIRFLPELRDAFWQSIRLRHLVSMRSGLRYNSRGFLPWQDEPRVYYSLDLRRLASRAQYEEPPGRRFHYNNYNVILLGMVLERVTSAPISRYLEDKIWKPLGMEYPASWSLDSEECGMEKMESGLNARAIDFAKFGRLYLRGGEWNGRQIVPERWVLESTTRDQLVRNYKYLWWLPDQGRRRYMAVGNLGQFIYVAPDRNAVIVRFGLGRPKDWRVFYPRLFASIVEAVSPDF
jgi:CubicO group peptidase (beta-lactamase class C family)